MYEYRSRITIDSTKCGEDDADFAFLFSGTYNGAGGEPDLRTVANGGHVHNTDASGGASGAYTVPADLVFSLSPDGITKLDFEVEFYNATTGELIAWVQSGVSTAADTVLYVVYGDAGVTTSQENVTGTWDANFAGVWHLSETSGQHSDSTSNAANSTTVSVTTQGSASGQINGADDFEHDSADYVEIANRSSLAITNNITVETWVTRESYSDGGSGLVSKSDFANHYGDYELIESNTNHTAYFILNSNAKALCLADILYDATPLYLVGTYDKQNLKLYADAGTPSSVAYAANINNNYTDVRFGNYWNANNVPISYFDGILDEVRISNIARSANYITTCYNSQNSPSTFYSVGGADRVRPCSVPSLPNLIIV